MATQKMGTEWPTKFFYGFILLGAATAGLFWGADRLDAFLFPARHERIVAAREKTWRQEREQEDRQAKSSKANQEARSAAQNKEAALAQEQEAIYNSAQESVRSVEATLRDPQSAIFKNIWAVRASVDGTEGTFACGTVNAKNAFGGYVGFTPFVAIGSTVLTPDDSIFAKTFSNVCLNGRKVMEIHR